ncbi:hypothetical protein EVAR_42059_1 [Eumeta japonica]|uniref:Uncharacterized protein n=1 Tax=Eumeta variegata TaxID=151549 RepID=A0A4C1XVP6_EUMVA|nr:hypothetical protein EVAR_42059_1 [Eumeta japonica]
MTPPPAAAPETGEREPSTHDVGFRRLPPRANLFQPERLDRSLWSSVYHRIRISIKATVVDNFKLLQPWPTIRLLAYSRSQHVIVAIVYGCDAKSTYYAEHNRSR